MAELAAAGLVPAIFAESNDPERLVPVVTEPATFMITVAGDSTRTNAYVLANDGPHGGYTAKRIDRSHSSDLLCELPDVTGS